jgi:hypothetical protein
MIGLTKEEEILRQVELAKNSEFGVTGVKIELEANFSRNGMYGQPVDCHNCDSDGRVMHRACAGDGCEQCWNSGNVPCMKCLDTRRNFNNTIVCYQWVLRYLKNSGLSYYSRKYQRYFEKKPLVFSLFYSDPSVGSEWTATLSLEKSESIFKLPELVRAFKALGEAIGNGIDVRNAGMHTSLLNDKNCFYPNHDVSREQWTRFHNFKRSMSSLMPALYFLGSDNSHSRSLHFREPRVDEDEKYSAIHYYGGALEFRVFETCYDNPERVLDNFVVMRNCIRFWTTKYKSPNLAKLMKEAKSTVNFGNDNNDRVDRFYTTVDHLDLLNAGIRKLKPAYKTIKQLKDEREFTVSKRSIRKMLKERITNAKVSFKEYEERAKWRREQARIERSYVLVNRIPAPDTEESRAAMLERVAQQAEEYITEHYGVPSMDEYIQRTVEEFERNNSGQFRLAVA